MKEQIRIIIQGHLDEKWKEWFDDMKITYDEDNTILSGFIKDETFLHGILNKIRDLNLKLISINPIEEDFENKQNNKN